MFLLTAFVVTSALVTVAVLISFVPLLLRRKLVSRLTVLDDLNLLGKARSEAKKIQGTAVVCGGR